jgi:hypothetical protein
MIVKLTNVEVHLKPEITWWDTEEIKAEMASGAKLNNSGLTGYDGMAMLNAKVKLMEKVVDKIATGEKVQSFSKEWLKTLSIEDGQKLDEAVENLTKKNE